MVCKEEIYKFCRRRNGRYTNNTSNRRLGRVGNIKYMYVITKMDERGREPGGSDNDDDDNRPGSSNPPLRRPPRPPRQRKRKRRILSSSSESEMSSFNANDSSTDEDIHFDILPQGSAARTRPINLRELRRKKDKRLLQAVIGRRRRLDAAALTAARKNANKPHLQPTVNLTRL